MTDLKRAASVLKEILGMKYEPVAVKFLKKERHLNGFGWPSGGNFCEMIIGSRGGQKLVLSPFRGECIAVAWILGIRVPPDKLYLKGPTGSAMSIYRMVASCPLAEALFKPDVVVIDATPEQLMWITRVHEIGGALDFNTGIVPGTPVDTTTLCFPVYAGKGTTAFACMRCHLVTERAEVEYMMLGFPVKDLDNIVHSLEKLKQQAIPRVRGKAIYQALLSKDK